MVKSGISQAILNPGLGSGESEMSKTQSFAKSSHSPCYFESVSGGQGRS